MNTNNGWLDIASAPKDGTEFLVRYGRQGGVVEIAKWNTIHGYFVSKGDPLLGFYTNVTEWAPLPPFVATPPASAQPERDWELSCDECNGAGHVFVERQVAERKSDVQGFKEECECCDGRGFTIAFEDIPGIAEYVKSCRPAPASAQDDAKDAARWRAFVGCARIRPLGSAGLEQPEPNHYAHMGLEIWTRYSRDYPARLLKDMDAQNERARRWLVMFADVAIAASQQQEG